MKTGVIGNESAYGVYELVRCHLKIGGGAPIFPFFHKIAENSYAFHILTQKIPYISHIFSENLVFCACKVLTN